MSAARTAQRLCTHVRVVTPTNLPVGVESAPRGNGPTPAVSMQQGYDNSRRGGRVPPSGSQGVPFDKHAPNGGTLPLAMPDMLFSMDGGRAGASRMPFANDSDQGPSEDWGTVDHLPGPPPAVRGEMIEQTPRSWTGGAMGGARTHSAQPPPAWNAHAGGGVGAAEASQLFEEWAAPDRTPPLAGGGSFGGQPAPTAWNPASMQASPPPGVQEVTEAFVGLSTSRQSTAQIAEKPSGRGWESVSRKPRKQKLYVGGLSEGTSEADIHQYFSQFGEVFDVTIPFDESQRSSKFYGFVKLPAEAASRALQCDEHRIRQDIVTVSKVGEAGADAAQDSSGGDVAADPFYRTKLCKNFLERGVCPYEDRCWFAHGEAQLRVRDVPEQKMADQAYRTKLCTHWEAGDCQYGDSCIFAHGTAGLRPFGATEGGPPRRPSSMSTRAATDNPAFRTQICTRWAEGSCQYGDRCNFAHGEEDLRPFGGSDRFDAEASTKGDPAFRTKLCTRWAQGSCQYGDRCMFAHGDDQLRPFGGTGPNTGARHAAADTSVRSEHGDPAFRTKLCTRWMQGSCQYGDRCNFAHGDEELRAYGSHSGNDHGGGGEQRASDTAQWPSGGTPSPDGDSTNAAFPSLSGAVSEFIPGDGASPTTPGDCPDETAKTPDGGGNGPRAPHMAKGLQDAAECDREAFGRWLGCFGLEAFGEGLVRDGVSNLALLRSLEECDVEEIMTEHGMQRMQKRVFKREWQKLRQQIAHTRNVDKA